MSLLYKMWLLVGYELQWFTYLNYNQNGLGFTRLWLKTGQYGWLKK